MRGRVSSRKLIFYVIGVTIVVALMLVSYQLCRSIITGNGYTLNSANEMCLICGVNVGGSGTWNQTEDGVVVSTKIGDIDFPAGQYPSACLGEEVAFFGVLKRKPLSGRLYISEVESFVLEDMSRARSSDCLYQSY